MIWTALRALAGGTLKRLFGFTCELATPGVSPYLVVANHNTNLDPALVGLSFPKQMYFVASEHVFRKGFSSWLLNACFRPISRIKGATDASAAMDIIRTLRKGHNVCLFAEGNRSFNGVTGPIFPATGKLAKASGAALITYKLEGGYLTTPRWAQNRRKGRMLGYCVNVYSADQLKSMSADAVNQAIAADLFEDAYARQEQEPFDYAGERLAEGLENAIFLCPSCGGIGTLKGVGDRFRCRCGLEAVYTVRGFLEGENVPFTTVRDWDRWQTEQLPALLERFTADEPVFSDPDLLLLRIGDDHKAKQTAAGSLSLSRQSLRVGGAVFPVTAISDMGLYGASTIVFTAGGVHYEIRRREGYFCARKYLMLYQWMKK